MAVEKIIRSKYKWILGAKALILLICCWLIYNKITDPERFGEEFTNVIRQSVDTSALLVLIGVLLLMPVNWLLEAMKWKVLARPHSKITTRQAFQGVLSGLSLGFVTPHGIGDYAGRLLSLQGHSRGQLLGSIWLGRAMQMSVTGLFGIVGVWIFIHKAPLPVPMISYWWWMVVVLGVLILAALYQSKVKVFGQRVRYYFAMIREYHWQEYIQIFTLSLGRYVVFSTQYLLILYIFEIPLPVHILFAGVSWMFLMKSIVPSFNFLSDLGVRELSVLTFFDLYQVSQPAVLTSSLLLWMINILIPVLIGLYFVLKLKPLAKQ